MKPSKILSFKSIITCIASICSVKYTSDQIYGNHTQFSPIDCSVRIKGKPNCLLQSDLAYPAINYPVSSINRPHLPARFPLLFPIQFTYRGLFSILFHFIFTLYKQKGIIDNLQSSTTPRKWILYNKEIPLRLYPINFHRNGVPLHYSHIRPHHLSGWALVPTQPDKRGWTVNDIQL